MTTKTGYCIKIVTMPGRIYYSRFLTESEAEEAVKIYRNTLAGVGGVLQIENEDGVVTLVPTLYVESVNIYPQRREVFQ